MGHCIRGVVFRQRDAASLAFPVGWPKAVALKHGCNFQPLQEEQLDELARAGAERVFAEHFTYLTAGAAEFLRARSAYGALVYLETDYFGGAGEQAAVVFDAGRMIGEPERGTLGPINSALARLGVARSGTDDEFDTIGLGRYRSMDDFAPTDAPLPLPTPREVTLVAPPEPAFFTVKSPGWTPSAELARALCGVSLLGWFLSLALFGCKVFAPGWSSNGWMLALFIGMFPLHVGAVQIMQKRFAGKSIRAAMQENGRAMFGSYGPVGWFVRVYFYGASLLCFYIGFSHVAGGNLPKLPVGPDAMFFLMPSLFYLIAARAYGTAVTEARAALRAQVSR